MPYLCNATEMIWNNFINMLKFVSENLLCIVSEIDTYLLIENRHTRRHSVLLENKVIVFPLFSFLEIK